VKLSKYILKTISNQIKKEKKMKRKKVKSHTYCTELVNNDCFENEKISLHLF